MANLIEERGLREQGQKIESLAKDIIRRLQSPYGVLDLSLGIDWEEFDTSAYGRVARIEENTLFLNKHELVHIPYDHAVRNTPVTLFLRTQEGEIEITFPYSKIIDWLSPATTIPPIFMGDRQLLTDVEITLRITEVVVAHTVTKISGWLATNDSNARCLRNGIISSYGHLIAETMPTPVSLNIWEVHNSGIQNWRETEGGFTLLYPHLKDCLYSEVVQLLQNAGSPARDESLPDFIARALEPLY